MESPDYLICINCESPCYVFEWRDEAPTEALCTVCGNDEIDEFTTVEDFEAMVSRG